MVTTPRYVDDTRIQENVQEALRSDPKAEPAAIGVAVEDGIVTLSGRVGSPRERAAAECAALRVHGVRGVANELEVRSHLVEMPSDRQIAHAAADAFQRDVGIPEGRIKVRVSDGRVILEGTVNWQYQREDAELVVMRLNGVRSVRNDIAVIPER